MTKTKQEDWKEKIKKKIRELYKVAGREDFEQNELAITTAISKTEEKLLEKASAKLQEERKKFADWLDDWYNELDDDIVWGDDGRVRRCFKILEEKIEEMGKDGKN